MNVDVVVHVIDAFAFALLGVWSAVVGALLISIGAPLSIAIGLVCGAGAIVAVVLMVAELEIAWNAWRR